MKTLQLMGLALVALVVLATPGLAQEKTNPTPMPNSVVFSGGAVGAGLGVAIAILGAGIGFGRIGAAAVEGMARQPEVAGRIQTAAIIIGALLEGATFFGLLVCILINGNAATW